MSSEDSDAVVKNLLVEREKYFAQAKAAIKKYLEIQDEVSKLDVELKKQMLALSDAINHLGMTSVVTEFGRAIVSKETVSISYDSKSIDVLVSDDPKLAERLLPYRKEIRKSSYIRVKRA